MWVTTKYTVYFQLPDDFYLEQRFIDEVQIKDWIKSETIDWVSYTLEKWSRCNSLEAVQEKKERFLNIE